MLLKLKREVCHIISQKANLWTYRSTIVRYNLSLWLEDHSSKIYPLDTILLSLISCEHYSPYSGLPTFPMKRMAPVEFSLMT